MTQELFGLLPACQKVPLQVKEGGKMKKIDKPPPIGDNISNGVCRLCEECTGGLPSDLIEVRNVKSV